MNSHVSHHSFQLAATVTFQTRRLAAATVLVFSGPLGQVALNLQKVDTQGLGGFWYAKHTHTLHIVGHSKACFRLIQKLIENKLGGVTRGWLMCLKIVGIGSRATLFQDSKLLFKVGLSHDIVYTLPASVKAFLPDPTTLWLFGVDKNQVAQIAAKIRDLRPPTVYKGKGIRLLNHPVLLKQGKKK